MPNLTQLRTDDLRAFQARARERYDAFAKRGVNSI